MNEFCIEQYTRVVALLNTETAKREHWEKVAAEFATQSIQIAMQLDLINVECAKVLHPDEIQRGTTLDHVKALVQDWKAENFLKRYYLKCIESDKHQDTAQYIQQTGVLED